MISDPVPNKVEGEEQHLRLSFDLHMHTKDGRHMMAFIHTSYTHTEEMILWRVPALMHIHIPIIPTEIKIFSS